MKTIEQIALEVREEIGVTWGPGALIEFSRRFLDKIEEQSEPVAWITKADVEAMCKGYCITLPARAMRIDPSYPEGEVLHLYLHPPKPDTEEMAAIAKVEWQPIETAPKIGRHLATMKNGTVSVIVWLDADHPDADEAGWYEHWHFDPVVPTHWMPIPAPPKVGAGGAATYDPAKAFMDIPPIEGGL